MQSMRTAILTVSLLAVLAATSAAQVPDPNLSTMVLNPNYGGQPGLQSCPAGDARPFRYIEITVLDAFATPIVGIPAADFVFHVIGGNVSFTPAPFSPATDVNGRISFSVVANEAILHPSMGGAPLEIKVSVFGVFLAQPVFLTCNTVDYDLNGSVNPIDFVFFSGDFTLAAPRSDFDWSGGIVDPIDFWEFVRHWTHHR